MKGLKNFSTISNGLVKQVNCFTEEVITEDGYTDLVCTFKIKSSMLINGFLETIGVDLEILDGSVIYYKVYRASRLINELSLDLCYNMDLKPINTLLNDIRYEADSYLGEKGYDFAYSLMRMVLSINSFDTNTYLYNNTTYNLVDVA